jgi:ABC-2 type transport system ATP-binding protein
VIAHGTPEQLKRELGGQESIELAVREPDGSLLSDIGRLTGLEPRRTAAGLVLSVDSAEALLPTLLPLIGNRIDSLSVRRPTLDDVFVAVTASATGGLP